MYGGNSYFQEIWGFLLILFFCVLERKGQIWISNKFGYEKSTYKTYPGTIKMEDYRDENEQAKKIGKL